MHSSLISNGRSPSARSWWQRLSKKRTAAFEERRDAAPPILIYQFGKVGSSSIYDSLLQKWPGVVIHTHTLKQHDKESQESIFARERVQRGNERVFIITNVREPIGRNISAFFQNFQRETGVSDKEAHTMSVHNLIELFLKKYPHNTPLNWFDEKFKVCTGIDVFNHNFPKLGVQIIRQGNIDLLLMLSEVPDWLKEVAIKQLLGLGDFRLRSANVGEKKTYADTYRQFLQTFTAPEWYVQQMYGSKFFRHFYPAQEEALTALWTRNANMKHIETRMELPVA